MWTVRRCPHAHGAASRAAWQPVRSDNLALVVQPCRASPEQGTTPPSQASPATSSSSPADGSSKEALLARIARARQYKQQGGASPPAPAPSPAPAPDEVPTRVLGAAAAPAEGWGAMTAFLSGTTRGADDGSSAGSQAGGTAQLSEQAQQLAAAAEAARRERFEAGARDKMSDAYSPHDTPQQLAYLVQNATQGASGGSAYTAAPALASVLSASESEEDLSSMRMEEITALKTQRLKQMGAEILTVDAGYQVDSGEGGGTIVTTARNANAAQLLGRAPPPPSPTDTPPQGEEGGQGQGEEYQPKVSTWGVFPRPKDISREYGGGRNLKPGQALETAEQKAAREAAYATALQTYKAQAGLEVDPEDEARAQQLYDQGMLLFKAANLQKSYDLMCQALDLVPLKSRVGGLAGLQKAVILDSQGHSEEAQKLYKRLLGHAVSSVARRAKQLLFGFQAAQYLKADTMSYAAANREFTRYFRGIADRNKIWVATEEERAADARAARAATLIALAVLLGPVTVLGLLISKAASSSG